MSTGRQKAFGAKDLEKRLDDAVGLDGVGEFLKAILVKDGAGLQRVGIDQRYGKVGNAVVGQWRRSWFGLRRRAAGEQRTEALTERSARIL